VAATPTLSKEDVVAKAEAAVGGKYNNWPTSLEYFAKDSDHVVLAHVVQIQNDQTQEWYEAFVDVTSGEIINVVSFVADASVSTWIVPETPHASDPPHIHW
jgi:extracellular elastinolytic metalloproteinase